MSQSNAVGHSPSVSLRSDLNVSENNDCIVEPDCRYVDCIPYAYTSNNWSISAFSLKLLTVTVSNSVVVDAFGFRDVL